MADQIQVYGIDLGTTYSCIACVDEIGKPVVEANAENERITPSVVFFDNADVIVGGVAKENAKLHPTAVAEMVKRSMGDPNYAFTYKDKTYRAEEISALILRKLVGDVEKNTKKVVKEVVITCPAWFGVHQREATANAGEIAGLKVRSIINEPTAAAIAYGMDQGQDQTVLVYDLGGGTFDITMIEVKGGDITVVCTGGDHILGGKEWDAAIVSYLVSQFQEQTGGGEDITQDPEVMQDLYNQAERAKKTLSQRDRAPLAVNHAGQRARVELTRDKFNELTSGLLDRTIDLTKTMLQEAVAKGFTKYDKILLVGGSTRMPQVMARLKQEFNTECELYDPDESVAKGAALFGHQLLLKDAVKDILVDKAGPSGPGEEASAEDKQKVVDEASPEEIKKAVDEVARKFNLAPAAVSTAVETTITNVSSKTFGIVAQDPVTRAPVVVNIVKRNDQVPADKTEEFGTIEKNQRSVELRLMECLEVTPTSKIEQTTELYKADLTDLPANLPVGSPIRVTFKLNDQGMLEMYAVEPSSGKSLTAELKTESVMSEEQVEEAKSKGLAMKVS